MLSSCLMGQTGPMHCYAGFGTMAAAVAGFYPVVGWPDRPPCGPFTAYTDYTSPRFAARGAARRARLAAADRRRTVHRLLTDSRPRLHLLAPELLDDAVNGRVAGRDGNRDRSRAPHGAYPTAGDDRWIAIAIETDEQWRALCAAAGLPADLAQLGARPPACHAATSSTRCSRPGRRNTTPRSCRRRCRRRACRRTRSRTRASASPTRNSSTAHSSARFRTRVRRHHVGRRQPVPALAHARPSGVGRTDVRAAPA